jgi:hypothetical protein
MTDNDFDFTPSPIKRFIPIPDYYNPFSKQAHQMRINADIIKKEITDHVDAEIARFKKELEECSIKKLK